MEEHTMIFENNCPLLKAGLCMLSLEDDGPLSKTEQLQAENEVLKKLVRYHYVMPMNTAGDYDENIAWITEADKALKGERTMDALTRIENMAEYGFADLDSEESGNIHTDALELMKEVKQLQTDTSVLKSMRNTVTQYLQGNKWNWSDSVVAGLLIRSMFSDEEIEALKGE